MRTLLARLPRLFLVITLLLIVAPEQGAAQSRLASLPPGMRVRVKAASLGPGARPSRVVTASADTLVVRPDDASGFDVALPRTEITQLDVSTGRRTRKGKLALIGLGAGVAVGWIAGVATFEDPCKTNPASCAGWFYDTRGSAAFGGAVAGGLLGAAAGAIAGHFWTTDRWQPFPLGTRGAAVRIQAAPSGGRAVALGLAVAVP